MAKRFFPAAVCIILSLIALSCSSGSKGTTTGGNGGGGGQAAIQFTAPTSSPVIESFAANPTVNLAVSAPSGATLTWTLQNGSGKGKPAGTLTASGTTATYTAPAPMPPLTAAQCTPSASAPYPQLQMTVVVSDGTDSATMPIVIVQTPPCVATTASIASPGICPPTATDTSMCVPYPALGSPDCTIGSSNCPCPLPGSLMVPVTGQSGLQPQPFQVNAFGSLQIYEGGGQGIPFGEPPFTWKLSSGSLPNGISIQPGPTTASIFLSGTPVSPGCTTFSLQVTDSQGVAATLPYFAAVVPSAIKVQAPNNFFGYGGGAYPPTALVASGGTPPYSWIPNPFVTPCNFGTELGGQADLPPGLSLSFPQNSVAMISGAPNPDDATPGNCGSYGLSLQVSDSQSPYPALGKPSVGNISVTSPSLPTLCSTEGTAQLPGLSLPADAYLQGTYAFMLRGFDANGPVAIAGSVQMDGNGNITSGEEDATRSNGTQHLTIQPTGSGSQSAYTVGNRANNGCMILTDSNGTTSTFAFTLGSCSNNFTTSTGVIQPSVLACGINSSQGVATGPAGLYRSGRMVEFDNSGNHLSGILRMQDPSSFTSGLNGLYAFGLSGWDSTNSHYAVAGSTQASAGSFSSAAADIDDAGTLSTALTGGSGTLSAFDSTSGRSAATITVGTVSFGLAVYVVDAHEAILVTTDQLGASHPILSGEAVGTAGPFSAASLHNSHIFHIGGTANGHPDVSIGILNFDGIGLISGTVFENQAGTLGTTSVSANYSVDATTGRTLFTAGQLNQTLGSHAFIGYIVPPSANMTRADCAKPASCVTGFLVGTDSSAQDGMMEFQTPVLPPPPPFFNAFVLGDFTFGTQENLNSLSTSSAGFVSAGAISSASNNTGVLSTGSRDTGFGDCWQGACRNLVPDEQLGSGAYTINTNGSGTFGGETVSVTNGRAIFYLDESPLNLYPSVMVAEQ